MELLAEYTVDFDNGKKIIVKNFTNWTSGNEIIDNFIKEKQLKYDGQGRVFEWIPYSELLGIKEIGDNCLNTAIFKNGSLRYYEYGEDEDDWEWIRESFEKVSLRYLHNSQDITDEFINKVESYSLYKTKYSTEYCYGITQNPDTRDYILVFGEYYFNAFCEKCGNEYEDKDHKWCKCQINHLENYFTNWTSGNKIIDNFIKEKQLKFNGRGAVFKWIPYNELIVISEVGKNGWATAILKNGPLYYKKEWTRKSYENVALRFLYDLQNITSKCEFSIKVASYLFNIYRTSYNYGISQNPDTNVYILVFSEVFFKYYCKNCGNKYHVNEKRDIIRICNQCQFKNNFTKWSSGNKIIDNFIQEKQLKYNVGRVFEWIPFNELIIKEIEDSCSTTAILKNGPLYYSKKRYRLIRNPCEKVCLKYLHNSHDITDEFITEVESYLINFDDYNFSQYYGGFGLSQNPDTKEYILVFSYNHFNKYCIKCGNKYEKEYGKWCKQCQINQLKNNFTNWTSGNEKIDEFIQKNQLRISNDSDTVFEWIPYDKFININETGKSSFTIAIWKDGPLYYSSSDRKYKRKLNSKVLLKYWHNLQNKNVFFNEIIYLINESYGISQIPNTDDFILILQPKYYCENCGGKYNNGFEIDNKSCILCQINHENKKINDLIQEIRLNINYNTSNSDIMFEWIPYDQFSNIKEIGKGGFSTVYLAIWKNGLLYNDEEYWKREPNTEVALKCLHNSQNSLDEFINKIKVYPKQKVDYIINLYGISQDPVTKDYIMVLEYAESGNFNDYLDKIYESFDWLDGLEVLTNIIDGLSKIHQKQMVHHDFHIGNILFMYDYDYEKVKISDMGLYRKIDDINETNIYGVMPYVAPEVLKGKPYTQAADIYSFGMVMYVIATGRQPYTDCAHDEVLALSICKGNRPEINEKITPKCYIDLMKRCWDLDPENRPNSNEIKEMIESFCNSLNQIFGKKEQNEIKGQFKETEEFRKAKFLSIKNDQSTTHTQAIYTSRLLNPFTKNLLK